MGKWIKAILFLIVSAILTRWIPFGLDSFFRNIDTMVHEFSHAIVTLALSGSVVSVDLNADHSGLTRSLLTRGWSTIPVAMAGYLLASLFAWLLFSLYARRSYRPGLLVISGIALISLVLFVRNSFGVSWLVGFLAVNTLVLLLGGKPGAKYYFLFVAFLCLEESVFGPVTLALAALANPEQAGDATVLARNTPIPAIAWGALFTLFSLWCAKNAIQAFVGRREERRQPVRKPYDTDYSNP